MAQTGYTPILIYASGTTGNAPSAANLTSSASGAELALNYFDGKLFYKDASGNVQVLAGKGGTGVVAGSNTQVQFNNNGVFGASANLTWDGSTLSTTGFTASGTVTFSGGTANGVAYLNGSKVLTTGSALTFDGSNFATSTGYISSGSGQFTAGPTGANSVFLEGIQHIFRRGSAGGYTTVFTLDTSGNAIFAPGGSEQMRLTSTGLGIGTSSPGTKLVVTGAGNITTTISSSSGFAQLSLSGSSGNSSFISYTTTGGGGLGFYDATAGAERMRLDSSGNLGIGTSSPAYKLDVVSSTAGIAQVTGGSSSGQGSAWYTKTGSTVLSAFGDNAAINGGTAGVKATIYTGNTIPLSFSISGAERMLLDASGNLGLGVTPSAWSGVTAIQVNGFGAISGDTNTIAFSQNVIGNIYSGFGATYAVTGQSALAYAIDKASGSFRWYTAPSGTAGNAITFTQAMTLDASGNLLVGATALTAQGKQEITFDGATKQGLNVIDSSAAATVTALSFIKSAGTRGSITVSTVGTSYNITSDRRLKNDLGVITETGIIANTVIHEVTYKADETQTKMLAVMAQDAVEVNPVAVTVGDDEVDENGNLKNPWQVDYSKYIPAMIVELQSLRRRVAELEAQ